MPPRIGHHIKITVGQGSIPPLVVVPEEPPPDRRMGFAYGNQHCNKPEKIGDLGLAVPVEPGSGIILIEGIVVASLRMQELVPHPEHRNAVRKEEQRHKVPGLLLTKLQHVGGEVLISFPTAIDTY